MKELFKSWAGIVKVLTYVIALVALVMGYLPVQTVVTVTLIISAIAKIAEIIVGITPSKVDDARVAEIVLILKDKGLLK